MRKYRNILIKVSVLIALSGLGILTSCEAIFEKNLEDQEVFLIIPLDSLTTDLAAQTFWWERVDGAEGYNLQIVSPCFDSILRLVLDTNITGERYEINLYPGEYQWRVRAYNYSSSTDYYQRILMILNTFDLSNQQVVLKSPAINFITKDTSVRFEWFPLNNATDYRFELKYDSWGGDYVINPVLATENYLTLDLNEGRYAWGVQAQNENSASLFTTRIFMIDTTRPGIPILIKPIPNDTSFSHEVLFEWSRPDTSGSSIKDSLLISQDSSFTGVRYCKYFFTDNITHRATLDFSGKYFWRVRSVDAAGNLSGYSQTRKFTIQDEE
jgi:hypothetical protein